MGNKKHIVTYKGYLIDTRINMYGFYDAVSIDDCDAEVIFATTIQGVKDDIDDLETQREDSKTTE